MDNYITCSVDFLKKKMGDSVICFFFRKADDSVRRAFGTLSPIIIDRYSSPSSEKKDSKKTAEKTSAKKPAKEEPVEEKKPVKKATLSGKKKLGKK